MQAILIFYVVVLWIANMILCGWLAEEKNRSVINWLVLTLFFGLLATLVLIGAPRRKKEEVKVPVGREEIVAAITKG